MHQTFQEAFDKTVYESARPNQEAVFDAFRAGKHVILKAPTGWGKTFAVNAAIGEGHYIYSLPLRVLVDSLAEVTSSFELYESIAHHGQERNHPFLDPGNDPNNPYRLVYTTLDQTLSAFLGIPIGVSLRQGNILPAVIDNSHLIFDEFHLFEPDRSWATALFALQRSKQNCIVLTATLSDYMLDFLGDFLSNKSEVGEVEIIEADRSFLNTKKMSKGDGFKNFNQLDIGARTIIIRNDIASAKKTAKELRNNDKVDLPVYLLHSEFLANDRKQTETQVKYIFKENSTEKAILVATQVVEAGIDITCDVMHTDLCPPSSFIQRVGRNARYEGEEGKIIWHPVENPGPYRSQKELIETLEDYLNGKKLLDEKSEQEIINLSEPFDKEQIEKFKKRNVREVNKIRALRPYSAYDEMIRSIDNKNVAIGTDLNQSYEFVSVARSKFYNKDGFFYKAAKTKPSKYGVYNSELREVVSTNRLEKADFVLLDPDFVGYRDDFGFTFDELVGIEGFVDHSKDTYTKYEYENETYEEHINRLYASLPTVSWMVDRLADHELIGTNDNADLISRFLLWGHDLGKLCLKWQEAHQVETDGIPIAHSEKKGRFGRIKRPPKHAWISACLVLEYLKGLIGANGKDLQLVKAVFWAIADHHGYSNNLKKKDFKPYKIGYLDYLDKMTKQNDWIENDWNSSILDPKVLKHKDTMCAFLTFDNVMPLRSSDELSLSLYLIFSYILRKADQKATELVSNEREVTKNSNSEPNYMV